MLILLLGLTVLASCASLLPFLVLCIGRRIRWICVIFGFPIWRFLSFPSNGVVTGFSVRRLLGHMRELTVPFLFPLCLCQRELKLDMVVSSSAVWALAKLLGGMCRFLPCDVGSHMSRSRHLGWNQCSHGLSSRPLESCHHQCINAVCGVLGCPKGSAAERLDGTLTLRVVTQGWEWWW